MHLFICLFINMPQILLTLIRIYKFCTGLSFSTGGKH